MESALQTARKSPTSRIVKSGEKGMSMQKAAPMAVHIPKPIPHNQIKVGRRDDSFEREANTTADRIMSTGYILPGAGSGGMGGAGSGGMGGAVATRTAGAAVAARTAGTGGTASAYGAHGSRTGTNLNPTREAVVQRKSQSQRMTVVPSSIISDEKKLQRKTSSSSGSDHQELPPKFYTTLQASQGGGHGLNTTTANFMNTAFHTDFSQVRIHTDAGAIKMNEQLHSEAFTHKNHIYFNSGKYQPESHSGKHLIAHELTHVVQQGYAGKGVSTDQQIQPSWLSAIGNAIDAAEDFVSDTIQAGIHKFLQVASQVIQKAPGYKALRVVLGHDPITGEQVAFNGHNFIEAGLDLIPYGKKIGEKLNELGALQQAEQWIDTKVSQAKELLGTIAGKISSFIRNIDLDQLKSPIKLLEHAASLIADGILAVTHFALTAGIELVNIIKKFLLKLLVNFIQKNTRLYPLLTVILGHDPVTGLEVTKNGTTILNAFILISEDGEQQKAEMLENGAFQKAAKWIDGAITLFSGAYQEVITGFHTIWDNASIEYLINPFDTFQKIYNIFLPPISRVLKFIGQVAITILKFIKDALKKKITTEAKKHQGYPLLTVLIGEDPFTGESVPRSIENLMHGFMSLMDNGEEQFKQMKESGAIARAEKQINTAVDALHFTKEYIVGLFMKLWNSFSIKDLFHPFEAFIKIVATLLAPIKRLIAFVVEIIKIAVHVILEIMQFPFDLIESIMSKVKQAFDTIKKDPVGFLKNLLRAIKEGFTQFFRNIGRHLLDGLKAWLASELKDAGVTAPTDFSFKGILGWVLDTLNITLDTVWKKIEKKIGAEKVAKVKAMVDKLDGAWTFIKDVQQRGLIAVWEKIKEKLSNLWDLVLDFIKGWMIDKIIEKVTVKLLSMLDPSGIMAVVNSTIAIYKAIQSAIQYLTRMLKILNTFVGGILEIAKGNIKSAAGFLEDSMAQGIPVMIGFLANQVSLGGIGKKVGEMIEKVREKVDGAIQWIVDKAWQIGGPLLIKIIDFVIAIGDKVEGAWEKAKAMAKSGVDKGKALGKAGIAKVKEAGKGLFSSVVKWWTMRQDFNDTEGAPHHFSFSGEGDKAQLKVASTERYMDKALDILKGSQDNFTPAQKKAYKKNIDKAESLNEKIKKMIPIVQDKNYKTSYTDLKQLAAIDKQRNKDIAKLQAQMMKLGAVMAKLMPLMPEVISSSGTKNALKEILLVVNMSDFFSGNGTDNQLTKLTESTINYLPKKAENSKQETEEPKKFIEKLDKNEYKKIAMPAKPRPFYLGSTPKKESTCGVKVIERMEKQGKYKTVKEGNLPTPRFLDTRNPLPAWLSPSQADMGHIVDAVLWWNAVGRFGVGGNKVEKFMNDSDNYELEESSHNRSDGASLGSDNNYKPPVS